MGIEKKIFEALTLLASQNYERASASEIAFRTKIGRAKVISVFKTHKLPIAEAFGETYVIFKQTLPIQAYWLNAPKSKLLGDQ